MKTVGKQLQEARLAKEWSPELAARETKIKVERLRELETDDYSNFSSPTYARGFVRTYARALGLDEYKILRQLDNKLPEDDNATFVNDTGVPYMPEPSQTSSSYKVGPGVYVAMGVGATVLFLIAFILFQSYRVGYFAKAIPVPPPPTNAAPVVTETEPVVRALPADSNAAPVALPVDIQPVPAVPAVATAVPATTTNQPPVAVASASTTAGGTTNSVTALAVTTNAPAAQPETTPLDTKTPPRALPVDLNALTTTTPDTSATTNATPATNAPAAVAATPATNTPTPVAAAPAPAPAPRPPPSLSARGANARPEPPPPQPHADAYTPVPLPIVPAVPATPHPAAAEPAAIAATAPAETAPETAPLTGEQPAPSAASDTMSAPATTASPESANTGAPAVFSESSSSARTTLDKAAGKRLVLTASHDSYIRVVSLDSVPQVRYSSVLHQGQSISFSDHKYSINVAIPSAVNIALDGINYGPHSDHAEPDTFTVESHQP